MANERPGDVADATLRDFVGGAKLFARYTLIKILGRGGMGVVWLAHDEELERDVALKFLPDQIVHDRAMLTDLKRETKRSLELTHKNIVRIYDFVNDERSACISMEYIDGDTLSNLRSEKERKVFEPQEITDWTAQLCDALDYAHNHARIIHRDLKPGNLMVNQRGDLKVQDFGIARSIGDTVSRLTMENKTSGTLVYMSPQQLDGEHGTHLDDIYSLGATLYDLLTSKPPFYSGNIDRQVHERVAPSMTERRKDLNIEPASVPPLWEEVVAACLQKDPTKRPQSTAEIANRLQLSTAQARTVPAFSFKGRKRKFLIGAAVAMVFLVAFGLFRWVGTFRRITQPNSALDQAQPGRASPPLPEKSIAVLPFDSFSGDKENSYFADGVQDDILTDLAKVADLKVISRRSVAQYRGSTKGIREIGQALQVAYVLEGTVRRIGDKVRLTAQLIDTRTEVEKWAEKYEREVADLFSIQNEISETIVAQLKATISPAEKGAIEKPPTRDMAAYDMYLQARSIVYAHGVRPKVADEMRPKAQKLLEDAIARDPAFVLAYCLLSQVQSTPNWAEEPSPEQIAKAKATAEAAVKLAPEAGEPHLALGNIFYGPLNDRARGVEELAIAARSMPNSSDVLTALGDVARDRGQWKEALRNLEKALQLDPRDADVALDLINFYTDLRRYREAELLTDRMIASLPPASTMQFWAAKSEIALERGDLKAARVALEASPNHNTGSTSHNHRLATILLRERRYADSAALIQAIPELAQKGNVLPRSGINPFAQGLYAQTLAIGYRAQGQKDKACAAFETARAGFAKWLLQRPEEGPALAMLAVTDAGCGRNQDALREARRTLEVWPMSREPINSAAARIDIAVVYAWTGDREGAIRLLAELVKLPGGPNAGDLKLNPRWDDLRKDPRFDQIVVEVSNPARID